MPKRPKIVRLNAARVNAYQVAAIGRERRWLQVSCRCHDGCFRAERPVTAVPGGRPGRRGVTDASKERPDAFRPKPWTARPPPAIKAWFGPVPPSTSVRSSREDTHFDRCLSCQGVGAFLPGNGGLFRAGLSHPIPKLRANLVNGKLTGAFARMQLGA